MKIWPIFVMKISDDQTGRRHLSMDAVLRKNAVNHGCQIRGAKKEPDFGQSIAGAFACPCKNWVLRLRG